MPLATMTSKGQITIPKEIRERLHLKPHDRLTVSTDGDKAILHPIHGTILGLKGIFLKKGMKPIDFKKLRQEAEEGMAADALRRARIKPPHRP